MHFHRKLAVLFIIYAWGTTSHFPFSSSSSLHFESILFTDDDIHGYTYFHSPTSMRLFNEFVSFLINVNVPGDIISRLFYSRRSNGLCLVSNFNYGQQLSRASSHGYAKRAFGDLEGMRVNGEICLLFHFDEIENTRPLGEEKFKDGSHKIHLAYASLKEVFPRISIGLEKIHCALPSFFFSFFFPLFFSILHRSMGKSRMLLFREGNTGESSSISTNKWNWTVWRALFRPMGVRSWRKLWKTEVKLPPEGISMVVPKERLRIVVNSCPRFFFVSSPFSIERNDFPSPYSRRSSLGSVQRKRLKKKKTVDIFQQLSKFPPLLG